MARYDDAALAILDVGNTAEEEGRHGEAIEHFDHAAKLGAVEALVNMANIYDDDQSGFYDPLKARALYKEALRKGVPEAAYGLANYYRLRGNRRWQEYWLRVGAGLGEEFAIDELAEFLSKT
ncbi:hypothetical protein [Methylobrevis albus]|uniref:Sel1 repeat family protein n=1 Tax=Methylobrevis albus TaxID=2793297 RepID=A0A931HZW6_9HYPH|nr:hypothetical protein [Methylobrevis albus]MBH0236733.1 hypothetical protein [Methylobrevis albus]